MEKAKYQKEKCRKSKKKKVEVIGVIIMMSGHFVFVAMKRLNFKS